MKQTIWEYRSITADEKFKELERLSGFVNRAIDGSVTRGNKGDINV
ncbi:MAG: hypothetical protein FWG63_07525 [Defluviitaleaceae bacterium]|nr:hypothetical protein [Defluviitaleaceae bacterium]